MHRAHLDFLVLRCVHSLTRAYLSVPVKLSIRVPTPEVTDYRDSYIWYHNLPLSTYRTDNAGKRGWAGLTAVFGLRSKKASESASGPLGLISHTLRICPDIPPFFTIGNDTITRDAVGNP